MPRRSTNEQAESEQRQRQRQAEAEAEPHLPSAEEEQRRRRQQQQRQQRLDKASEVGETQDGWAVRDGGGRSGMEGGSDDQVTAWVEVVAERRWRLLSSSAVRRPD